MADDGAAINMQVLPFADPHAEGRLMLVRFVELQDGPAPGSGPVALPEPACQCGAVGGAGSAGVDRAAAVGEGCGAARAQ